MYIIAASLLGHIWWQAWREALDLGDVSQKHIDATVYCTIHAICIHRYHVYTVMYIAIEREPFAPAYKIHHCKNN